MILGAIFIAQKKYKKFKYLNKLINRCFIKIFKFLFKIYVKMLNSIKILNCNKLSCNTLKLKEYSCNFS